MNVKERWNSIVNKIKKLFRSGFFHIFGSSTISKIVAFASAWIIVRIISKPEYGIYTYAYNIYSFVFLCNGLGIGSAVLQICSENCPEERKDRVYKYGSTVGLLFNLVLAIILIAIGLFIELPIQGSNYLLVLMSFIPLVSIIPEMQTYYLRFNRLNKQYSFNNVISSLIILVCACVFSILLASKGLVLSNYIAQILILCVSLFVFKAPIKVGRSRLSSDEKKSIYSIAIISMINNGLSRLMYLLDIFVLGIILSDSLTIAAYRVATNIPTALQFIPSALIIYLYPYFASHKGDGQWLKKRYKELIVPFGVFNLFVTILLILFAKQLIVIFFGNQYIDSVVPFQILSIGYFFSATFRSIAGNLLVTQRKLKFNLAISVFSGIINTILNIIMIRQWGSNGAAIATVITSFITGLISTIYLLRVFNSYER